MSPFKTILAASGICAALAMPSFAETIVITPDQDTAINDYIVKEGPVDAVVPDDYDLSVGAVLPDAVEVHRLDTSDFGDKYDYVVIKKRKVIVDRGTRKVVHIIGN